MEMFHPLAGFYSEGKKIIVVEHSTCKCSNKKSTIQRFHKIPKDREIILNKFWDGSWANSSLKFSGQGYMHVSLDCLTESCFIQYFILQKTKENTNH